MVRTSQRIKDDSPAKMPITSVLTLSSPLISGCFYPTFGVISEEYRNASFIESFQFDYGFWVAPDTDPGNNNGPEEEEEGRDYSSLKPMGISFDGLEFNNNTYLFGYPGARDPDFMFTEGPIETSPLSEGGWFLPCSLLTAGASGGPWTQSDVKSGRMVVEAVNSWGWSNGDPGMGSPPFGAGAECVYDAANTAEMDSSSFAANCPK